MTTFTIEAPMPGVFYRSPDPEDPPFVEVGDSVSAGDTVALVGVMKNFYDVTSEKDGVVSEIIAENEAEIEAGAGLITLELDD
ncbi:biotin carboxyl carrier domain-containing protein [Salinigranum rubrum]|uniref:Biotin carboxyl carrier protein of acetyl-CoA carboxylase n=1 Tax=Salinigranum rubrum TaxID=755307 RepID=A0A2I8VJ12_9EURY|nr:acetyl-CoA carboxylase [Salinigranum rubrum]AUV81927.1 biotin carboxyl carrier domain-containing protein [Salinigranum rubrum]